MAPARSSSDSGERRPAPVRAFDWLFRTRRGRIVLGQWPNPPLWIFLGASALRRLADPPGWTGTASKVVATTALAWWAVLEIGWGATRFRRLLGAVVLTFVILGLVA